MPEHPDAPTEADDFKRCAKDLEALVTCKGPCGHWEDGDFYADCKDWRPCLVCLVEVYVGQNHA